MDNTEKKIAKVIKRTVKLYCATFSIYKAIVSDRDTSCRYLINRCD